MDAMATEFYGEAEADKIDAARVFGAIAAIRTLQCNSGGVYDAEGCGCPEALSRFVEECGGDLEGPDGRATLVGAINYPSDSGQGRGQVFLFERRRPPARRRNPWARQGAPQADWLAAVLTARAEPEWRMQFLFADIPEVLGATAAQTALNILAGGGVEADVRLLLELGAPPDPATAAGHTPLMFAASGGHAAAIRLLLAAGADPDAADWSGKTALYHAVRAQALDCVAALLAGGAEADPPTLTGDTPVNYAARSGCHDIVDQLAAAGAILTEDYAAR